MHRRVEICIVVEMHSQDKRDIDVLSASKHKVLVENCGKLTQVKDKGKRGMPQPAAQDFGK